MEIEKRYDKFLKDYPQADKHPVFFAQKTSEEGLEMLVHADRSPNPEDLELATKEAGDAYLSIVGYAKAMGINMEAIILAATLKIDELEQRHETGYYDKLPKEKIIYTPAVDFEASSKDA